MTHEKWDTMTDTEKVKWKERQYYIRSIIASILGAVIVSLLMR